jgi:hypothetical protein
MPVTAQHKNLVEDLALDPLPEIDIVVTNLAREFQKSQQLAKKEPLYETDDQIIKTELNLQGQQKAENISWELTRGYKDSKREGTADSTYGSALSSIQNSAVTLRQINDLPDFCFGTPSHELSKGSKIDFDDGLNSFIGDTFHDIEQGKVWPFEEHDYSNIQNLEIDQKEDAVTNKQTTVMDEPQNQDGAHCSAASPCVENLEVNRRIQDQLKSGQPPPGKITDQSSTETSISGFTGQIHNPSSEPPAEGRTLDSVKYSFHPESQEGKSGSDDGSDIDESDDWDDLTFGYGSNRSYESGYSSSSDNDDRKLSTKRRRLNDKILENEKIRSWQESINLTTCSNGSESTKHSQASGNSSHGDQSSSYKKDGKRKRDDMPDEISSEGNRNNREQQEGRSYPEEDQRRLKCPFYQRQPNRPWPNACRGKGWLTMKDLT